MKKALNEATILVIDDDTQLCEAIELVFVQTGATVHVAYTGRSGLQQFFKHRPDLTILDIWMPDMDGWETLHQIRLLSDSPVILLTTLRTNESIVRGLDGGADDFISKPFDNHVLLSRARAVLRRVQSVSKSKESIAYSDDHLSIDLKTRQVFVSGQLMRLTATEFQLLTYLMKNAERVLTYVQILENVWGSDYRDNVDYVHVYLSHLRRKLEKDPRKPQYLLNEHGIGYRFKRRHLD